MKLDTLNPNHIKFNHEELFIEVLGGVNTESYMSMRVMLVVRGNRKTERDHIDLYNNYQLTGFVKKVAQTTGFTIKYVEEAVKALTDELEEYKHELIEKEAKSTSIEYDLQDEDAKQAKEFLKQKGLLGKLNDLIGEAGVIGNEKNRLILFLTFLSRIQEQPLHAVVKSRLNYLQTKVGELVPKEQKRVIRHLSDNVLFYFDENELSNKLLLIEDTGTNKVKLLPLLDFQANGHLTKLTTQKDQYGKLRAVEQMVNGPIVASISTPRPESFQNSSVLSLVIHEDDSKEQDKKVICEQRLQSAGKVNLKEQMKATELLWNLQRVIQPLKVINPMAELLELPDALRNKQINNVHYLRFIETVTLLKQFERKQKVDEQTGEVFIETSAEDIKEANQLLETVLVDKCDVLHVGVREYFEKLKVHVNKSKKKTFTNADMSLAFRKPVSTVKRYNSILVSNGFVQPTGEGNRNSGYVFEIVNSNEFTELEKSVNMTLSKSMKAIDSSSPLTVAHSSSEPLIAITSKGMGEVAQQTTGGHKGKSNQKRKAS